MALWIPSLWSLLLKNLLESMDFHVSAMKRRDCAIDMLVFHHQSKIGIKLGIGHKQCLVDVLTRFGQIISTVC